MGNQGNKIELDRIKNFILFRSPWRDIIQYIAVIFLLLWFFSWSTAQIGYIWYWHRIPRYIVSVVDGSTSPGPLLEGLVLTLKISGVSLVFSFALGLTTALLRLSNSVVGKLYARIYLEFIRNTPLLVQLFFVYFIIGPILGLGRFTAAVLALTLFEGAYTSEIFRGGIISIHKGQWEAAYSLGMSNYDMYRDIILPQAVRRVLPPLTNQAITLIKDSALVSLVSLADLTQKARIAIAQSFMAFEIWFTTAGIYLVITVTLSIIVSRLEKKFKIYT